MLGDSQQKKAETSARPIHLADRHVHRVRAEAMQQAEGAAVASADSAEDAARSGAGAGISTNWIHRTK